MVNDLVLTFQIDGATHQNERCVESILITSIRQVGQVNEGTSYDFVVNTFCLALMVYAHIANHTKTKLSYFGVLITKDSLDICIVEDLDELADCIFAK